LTDRDKLLGEGKVASLLLKFSIPAIVGMLVNALYNVVDRIFIGWGVGSLGIAGITIGFPIMIVMMAFGMLIGIGATSLISIRLGEKKKEEAELIMANAAVLLISVSLIIAIAGLIFLDPLLRFFGASEDVLPYASEYLKIILYGSLFSGIGFGMNNIIRAEGNPKFAMYSMLIGAITNTVLDPIFIFVFGWGIRGAAIATIISQATSAVWVVSYFLSGRSILKIRLKNLKLRKNIVSNILAIGSAPFAMQIAAGVLTVILNNSLMYYGGDTAIAAMGIINSISMLILMPIFGINQGSQPIIGYNYGAMKFDRVKHTLKLAILSATAIVMVGFIICRIFPEQLIRMFNNKDEELVRIGVRGLQIFFALLPIIGFQIVSANYFQAVGKPKHAMFLSLSRQVILLIPAVIILPRFFQLDGIFMAGPVSDFGASILTGIWILREMRHLDERRFQILTTEATEE
jgi:putative MATE family efflux protein